MAFIDRLTGRIGHRLRVLMTEHLDARLDARAEERLRRLADASPALRQRLSELEATVAQVRSAPMLEPPRSFTLPRTAVAPAVQPARQTPRLGGLRLVTAAAAVLLLALVGGELSGVLDRPLQEAPLAADAPSVQESAAVPQDDAPAARALSAPEPEASDAAASAAGDPAAAETPPATVDELPEGPPSAAGRSAVEWLLIAVALAIAVMALAGVALAGRLRGTSRPPDASEE